MLSWPAWTKGENWFPIFELTLDETFHWGDIQLKKKKTVRSLQKQFRTPRENKESGSIQEKNIWTTQNGQNIQNFAKFKINFTVKNLTMEAPNHYKNTLDEGRKTNTETTGRNIGGSIENPENITENEQQTKEGQQKGEEQNDIAMIQEEIATLKCKKIRMKKEMEELQRRLLKLRDDNRDVFDASVLSQ